MVYIMETPDLERIAKKHGILLILQFGSSVTGKGHARSDVDLDLALLNHADPLFLKKITDNCQLLYGSPRRLQQLKIYAFKRYQDHRKYFEMERQFVARSLSSRPAND